MKPLDKIVLYSIIILTIGIAIYGVIVLGQQSPEITIYRPDGTVEYCVVYKDGTVWCR